MQLEICCFNIASAMIAGKSGASRIELCDNAEEGGTTPSFAYLETARKKLQIPMFPIIRARGGDFLYTDDEFRIMLQDVQVCKQLGCDGVVIGMLTREGKVDKQRSGKLVQVAYPMAVTFHRAFDRVREPFQAIDDIIDIGCERILTSGRRPTVEEGLELISQMISEAGERIIIMPGSGVRSENILAFANATGATEFHSSARIKVESSMNYINEHMKEVLSHVMCDGEEIKKMATNLALR